MNRLPEIQQDLPTATYCEQTTWPSEVADGWLYRVQFFSPALQRTTWELVRWSGGKWQPWENSPVAATREELLELEVQALSARLDNALTKLELIRNPDAFDNGS